MIVNTELRCNLNIVCALTSFDVIFGTITAGQNVIHFGIVFLLPNERKHHAKLATHLLMN